MMDLLVLDQREGEDEETKQWMRDFVTFVRSENTHVFLHHVYEYKKGLRNLILHTTSRANETKIRDRLERERVAYLIYPLGKDKMNVFFGESICIDVIKQIGKSNLCDYTDEEDFLLGIMLGYDRKKQCERYLQRKQHAIKDQLLG
jgi:hypothetical protein